MGHYQGISKAFPKTNCAIVNIDAHYDLRPLNNNQQGTSGTSFLQIYHERQAQGLFFEYACLGIQKLGIQMR